MRILICGGLPAGRFSIEWFYKNAFEHLGHTVRLMPFRQRLPLRHRVTLRLSRLWNLGAAPAIGAELVERSLGAYRPDLVLVFRGEDLRADAAAFLHDAARLGSVNVYTDAPFRIPGDSAVRLTATFATYRIVYTFSRALVPVFHQLGARDVRWLPFAYDPVTHVRPHDRNPARDRSPVVYFGAWGPLQEEWLSPLVSRGLTIYGNHWHSAANREIRERAWRPGQGIGPGMAAVMADADIVFNLIRAEHGCAHSMKTFEIPACAAFMLTNWTEEQAEFLKDGRECAYFRSKEEMLEKIDYYARHESDRRRIAAAGALAVEPHTYVERVKAVLADVGA